MAKAPKSDSDSGSSKIADARARNLDAALQQISKDYGEGAIIRMGEGKQADVAVIPTGNLLIDQALGIGGFPRGRIIEVFGPESSGKTTLTLTVIAQAQKAGGLAAFIDVEHALDPKYARSLGVKLDDLLVSQPSIGRGSAPHLRNARAFQCDRCGRARLRGGPRHAPGTGRRNR